MRYHRVAIPVPRRPEDGLYGDRTSSPCGDRERVRVRQTPSGNGV